MSLVEWIQSKGLKKKKVAELLGISKFTMWRICYRTEDRFSRELVLKIRALTKGKVAFQDFREKKWKKTQSQDMKK